MTWSLHKRDGTFLKPLEWKGGNQDECVKTIVDEFRKDKVVKVVLDKNGNTVKNENVGDIEKSNLIEKEVSIQKVLFLLSKMGSGKSSICLNVIKDIGRGIVVVPSLHLQDQYIKDYGIDNKYILKEDGNRLKISTMIGRKNFVCKHLRDAVDRGETLLGNYVITDKLKVHCSLRGLPCNRILRKDENRIVVGSECKYFIPPPRIKKDIEEWIRKGRLVIFKNMLKADDIRYYKGVDNNEYGMFIKNDGIDVCDYYKQFYGYISDYSDVIIMNKHKWSIETVFGRKPLLDVEVIDESDEFLNGLNESIDITNRDVDKLFDVKDKNEALINPVINGILEDKGRVLLTLKSSFEKIRHDEKKNKDGARSDYGLMSSIKEFVNEIKKVSYENDIEVTESDDLVEMMFKLDILGKYIDKSVMTTTEGIRTIGVKYNIPYPDLILKNLMSDSCNKILMSSATSHSDYTNDVLFGLNFDRVIHGRIDQPGKLIISSPKKNEGRDMVNVTYQNWKMVEFRDYYNALLNYMVTILNKNGNTLVLTNAKKYVEQLKKDLITMNAKVRYDFSGEEIVESENGIGNLIIISQRMKRGVDLRDDLARVIIWTKFPLADISDGYIKSIFNRFGNRVTWRLLNDIAEQDVIQGIGRGLRHDNDWVIFATPDIKVYDVVNRWWQIQTEIKSR